MYKSCYVTFPVIRLRVVMIGCTQGGGSFWFFPPKCLSSYVLWQYSFDCCFFLSFVSHFIRLSIIVSCPTDEGVYINASGEQVKDVRLQWGEIPSSIGESVWWGCGYWTLLGLPLNSSSFHHSTFPFSFVSSSFLHPPSSLSFLICFFLSPTPLLLLLSRLPLLLSFQPWLVTPMWWVGGARLLRYVQWRTDNLTVSSCTREHRNFAFSAREMTRFGLTMECTFSCHSNNMSHLCTYLCMYLLCALFTAPLSLSYLFLSLLSLSLSSFSLSPLSLLSLSLSSLSLFPTGWLALLSIQCLCVQVFFASIRSSSSSQVYFMALNRKMGPPK